VIWGRAYRRLEHNTGHVHLVEATVAEPGDTGIKVVVAPEIVGVCRSDLREILGTRHLRRDFGHEIVGAVVASTDETLVPSGQRIAYDPHPAVARSSGFGELIELEGPAAKIREALVPLPGPLPAATAVFAEPLACVCHCLDRLETVTAQAGGDGQATVAVIGAGMAGALMAGSLHARGIPVAVFNRTEARCRLLREQRFLPAESFPASAAGFGGAFARVVVASASADEEVMRLAAHLLSRAGVLMVYAGTGPGARFGAVDLDQLRREEQALACQWEGKDLVMAGSHGALRRDFQAALGLLTDGRNGDWRFGEAVQRLVTNEMSLGKAAGTLEAHAAAGFLGKAIVTV
jgi:threonine dehydrogenase-like Zn-dependent dehydrogenase